MRSSPSTRARKLATTPVPNVSGSRPSCPRRGRALLGQPERGDAGVLGDAAGLVDRRQPATLDVHVGVRGPDGEEGADPQALAPLAEHAAVDHLVGQVAAHLERPVGLPVVVRELGDDGPADRPDVFPVPDRGGRGGQPAPHRALVERLGVVMRDRPDVALRALEVVVDALAGLDVARADPHLSAGVRSGPADQLGSLEHRHGAPVQRRAERGRQPRQPRADDDHGPVGRRLGSLLWCHCRAPLAAGSSHARGAPRGVRHARTT